MRWVIRAIFIYLIVSSAFAHSDQELEVILRSESWSQLHLERQKTRDSAVRLRACRIQMRKRLIPASCFGQSQYSKSQIQEACQKAAFTAVTLPMIQNALKLKDWDPACRRKLLEWEKRKIYQAEDEPVGASFVSHTQNAGDIETGTTDL